MAVANNSQVTDEEAEPAGASVNALVQDSYPDGGRLAWLQVAGCFALYWNTLGILNCFGVFQTYYELNLLKDSSSSAISWIGSIQAFCLMAVGVLIGPLYDAGAFYSLLYSGTFLVVLGFMMTSICSTYWQVFLAQGICIGLGTSCLSIPGIALVPMYFNGPKRASAMATATMGSCLGATICPLIFTALQPRIGFPWATRVEGFISLATCSFSIVVLRPRYKPRRVRTEGTTQKAKSLATIIRSAALGEKRYIVYCISIFFSNLAFFEPLYYIQSYANSHGLQDQEVTKYLLTILNGASIFGRLVPSFMAHRLSIIDTFIIICFMSAASVFYWTSATNAAGNIAFAVLYGFFSGGVVAFAPVVLTSITKDMSYLGTRFGFLSILKGIGSLCGPPIGGAIFGATGGYLGVQLFTGFSIFLCVAFSSVLRALVTRNSGIRP